jgi:hypothetical protein
MDSKPDGLLLRICPLDPMPDMFLYMKVITGIHLDELRLIFETKNSVSL